MISRVGNQVYEIKDLESITLNKVHGIKNLNQGHGIKYMISRVWSKDIKSRI